MHTRWIVLLLAGCASAHTPEQIGSGIYDLRIEGDVEDCAPARPTGAMGAVAVLVEDEAIDAPVPDAPTAPLLAPRVRLTPESAFHVETNRNLPSCAGAWVHETWTVMSTASEAFELAHTQAWQGVESCADASAVPAADCRSERHFRYTLRTACAAPCTLVLAADDTVACSCD